ncbi:MAG: hypothetical protein WBD20_23895 [Pirellulaceae bacterium]
MPVTPLQTKRRLLPHFAALATIFPVYLVVAFLTHQPTLAVALAAATALIVFIIVRLIQLRGKLTLSLTVLGFPLLVAMGFASFAALDPFLQLQRQADMLRDAGLNFQGRQPDEGGEWKRTHDGVMLPIWLANRIGSDCMTKTRSIGGDIERLQAIRFRDLGTESVRYLELRRDDREPSISPELVDWINELDDPRITLNVRFYRDKDGLALRDLRQRYSLHMPIDDRTGDLSQLGSVGSLWLSGDRITIPQAKQLTKLKNLYSLELEVLQLDAKTIESLQSRFGTLKIVRAQLDADAWNALAKTDRHFIELAGIDLKNLPSKTNDFPSSDPPRWLQLYPDGVNIKVSDTERLVRFFDREILFVAANLSDQQIMSLWKIPQLKEIRYRDANSEYAYVLRPQ